MKLFKLTWSASSFGFEEHESIEEFENLEAAEIAAYSAACDEFVTEFIGCVDNCPTLEEYQEEHENDKINASTLEDDWCALVDYIMDEEVQYTARELTETEGCVEVIRNIK